MRSDKPKIYRIGSTFNPLNCHWLLQVDALIEHAKLAKTKKIKTLTASRNSSSHHRLNGN
jgi:hypothetical protein